MPLHRNATPSLHHYLRRIARAGHHHDAARRSSTSGAPSADELVADHLRLVPTIARRYWFDGVALDDLVQAGNLGLLRAARSFDPDKGGRTTTWIAFGIRQAILDHLAAHQHPVALPRAVHQRYVRGGRVPVLGGSTELRFESIPLENRADTDGAGPAISPLPARDDPCPAAAEVALLAEEIRQLLGVLDETSRRLVVERFGLDGLPPRGVVAQAATRGVSREAVRLRFVAAMTLLRREAEQRRLDLWLDDS